MKHEPKVYKLPDLFSERKPEDYSGKWTKNDQGMWEFIPNPNWKGPE